MPVRLSPSLLVLPLTLALAPILAQDAAPAAPPARPPAETPATPPAGGAQVPATPPEAEPAPPAQPREAQDPAAPVEVDEVQVDEVDVDQAPAGDTLSGASDDPDAVESATTRVPLEEIRRYVGLFNAIRAGYVDPVDDRKLMDSAIRGLLLDLDPHSAYLEKSAAEAFSEGTTGAYDGIGVEVLQLPDGKVRVIAPIDDTPAAKAGIRAGDTIVSVNGRPLTPADAEGPGPLRGPPGSTLVLGIEREGEAQPLQLTVRRETIRVASVRGRMLEPGYGYVRISAFQVETGEDFSRELARLNAEAGGRLRGLVIDLRSNPGGLLTAAVRVADDLLEGAPVVVLIDAGSASASEVLAGALQDNGRARIVGSRSFGKGSVQTLLPLGNGDAVKLTTARYYTPSGRSIQARGIDPEVVLQPEAGEAAGPLPPRQIEAMLPGHLRGDEEEGAAAGDVLPGEAPVQAALAELKKPRDTAARPAAATTPARD